MDINKLMKEAQNMQKRMQEAQEALNELMVRGEAGGGKVKVDMNGRHDVIKVTIAPSLMEEDIAVIEEVFAAAVNNTVQKVAKVSQEKMKMLTSDLNISPELFKDNSDK